VSWTWWDWPLCSQLVKTSLWLLCLLVGKVTFCILDGYFCVRPVHSAVHDTWGIFLQMAWDVNSWYVMKLLMSGTWLQFLSAGGRWWRWDGWWGRRTDWRCCPLCAGSSSWCSRAACTETWTQLLAAPTLDDLRLSAVLVSCLWLTHLDAGTPGCRCTWMQAHLNAGAPGCSHIWMQAHLDAVIGCFLTTAHCIMTHCHVWCCHTTETWFWLSLASLLGGGGGGGKWGNCRHSTPT